MMTEKLQNIRYIFIIHVVDSVKLPKLKEFCHHHQKIARPRARIALRYICKFTHWHCRYFRRVVHLSSSASSWYWGVDGGDILWLVEDIQTTQSTTNPYPNNNHRTDIIEWSVCGAYVELLHWVGTVNNLVRCMCYATRNVSLCVHLGNKIDNVRCVCGRS